MVSVYLLQEPVVELHKLGEANAVVTVCVEFGEALLDLIDQKLVCEYAYAKPSWPELMVVSVLVYK